jgi:catechol 2,3-dioxygenase-like lactoylglutathione lyase family enzyme
MSPLIPTVETAQSLGFSAEVGAVARVHHSAIGTRDVEGSLTFWRDGLGFEVLMDQRFTGDWPGLFGGSSTDLRSVFLGDPSAPEAGVVELVVLGDMVDPPETLSPATGFFLLSLFADIDTVLPRLASLGVGGVPKVVEVQGVRLVVIHDPNGVRIELMDSPARSNLGRLADDGA